MARQYVTTAAASGSMAPLLFGRTDAGVADPCYTPMPTVIGIARPSVKQDGSDNPVGAVEIYWSDSDQTPSLSDAVCIGVLISGSSNAEIAVGDLSSGWFWARTDSGSDVELHITERRI